jgi:hypothetical protein
MLPSEPDKTERFSRDASSIAPFAVDVGQRRPSQLLAETYIIPPSRRTSRISLAAAAGAIAALSILSAVSLRVPPTPHALGQPRTARVVGAHEAVLIPVRTAPNKDLIDLDDDTSTTLPVSALPSHRAVSMPTAARPSQTGLLRVAPSVKGILVDGAPHRVDRGVVSLPCGTHTIKAPSLPARTLVVACAATTTL